ncbi:PREDICTED: uncharacterized protein [Prunus dulcis]|uniref:PREDICTED: uncharacterized protein n=1 Tax=Prunus dulcis TaxID=3755 RepID=A0A5E4EIS5_PRUDU|nr:PREDICTED: uncharacterized protein [Prunus dulcis]
MASPSDYAASVPPSILLPPQPTGPLLPPQSDPLLPPKPTFYVELNAKGYKFTKPEHPLEVEPKHLPEIATAPSKAGATINLKILINSKYLNTAMAEDATATPKAPKDSKALKATPIKLKILMNGKDIALAMAEAAELRYPPPSQS